MCQVHPADCDFWVLLLSAAPAVVALGEPRKNGETGKTWGRSMGCRMEPHLEVLGMQGEFGTDPGRFLALYLLEGLTGPGRALHDQFSSARLR